MGTHAHDLVSPVSLPVSQVLMRGRLRPFQLATDLEPICEVDCICSIQLARVARKSCLSVGVQVEVGKHEPWLALDGGEGPGLDSLHTICQEAARFLCPGGFLALEVTPMAPPLFACVNPLPTQLSCLCHVL